ncbi:MAG: serine/threonine protein kinase [Chloroflexi bacterium]|nr:serine/threonine protein kinase [Chloroflexota bacterium]
MAELIADRYEILEEIGSGGTAVVYRARDTRLDRLVALKVLREQYVDDHTFVQRFEREARAVASLDHPNIVDIYDFGDKDNTYYIAMQYVDGVSLRDRIRDDGPLGIAESVEIARQMLAGLQAAHDRGIVHRDVKPLNVLHSPSNQVKLTDFGIARAIAVPSITEIGSTVGSVHYIAPEQALGKEVGPATDIYATAIVLYEMLTNRVPFEGGNPTEVALKHVQETPTPPTEFRPGLPRPLEEIILKGLSKEPEQRFASASEMSGALSRYLESTSDRTFAIPVTEPVAVAPVRRRPPPGPPPGPPPVPVVAGRPPAPPRRPPPVRRYRDEGGGWQHWLPLALPLALMLFFLAAASFAAGLVPGFGRAGAAQATPTQQQRAVLPTFTTVVTTTPTPTGTPTPQGSPSPGRGTATPTETVSPTATGTATRTAATTTPQPATPTRPPATTATSTAPAATPTPAVTPTAAATQTPASAPTLAPVNPPTATPAVPPPTPPAKPGGTPTTGAINPVPIAPPATPTPTRPAGTPTPNVPLPPAPPKP